MDFPSYLSLIKIYSSGPEVLLSNSQIMLLANLGESSQFRYFYFDGANNGEEVVFVWKYLSIMHW